MYGLAVALARDERTDQAHDVISAQGEQAMAEFHRRVAEHITFFVPEGEEAYYFALAYESFGMTDSAIEYWKKFLVSKAAVVHPQFKQRAREHLDPLLHERTRKAIHLETPWRDLIRKSHCCCCRAPRSRRASATRHRRRMSIRKRRATLTCVNRRSIPSTSRTRSSSATPAACSTTARTRRRIKPPRRCRSSTRPWPTCRRTIAPTHSAAARI